MWPYWMLGVMVMVAVIAVGQKHLLRVEKKPVLKWIAFLGGITLWRLLLSKLVDLHMTHNVVTSMSPFIALTVGWEDLCHSLPLFLVKKYVKFKSWTKIFYYILMLCVMVEFGAGHLYQSPLATVLLSFYIPYSVKIGEKYGWGTLMINHMLYDFVTLVFVRHIIGA